MVQRVNRSLHQAQISSCIQIGAQEKEYLTDILNIYVMIKDHDHLGKHHLAEAPQCVHHLVSLAGVTLTNGHKTEIVKHPLHRQIYVHDLRKLFLD